MTCHYVNAVNFIVIHSKKRLLVMGYIRRTNQQKHINYDLLNILYSFTDNWLITMIRARISYEFFDDSDWTSWYCPSLIIDQNGKTIEKKDVIQSSSLMNCKSIEFQYGAGIGRYPMRQMFLVTESLQKTSTFQEILMQNPCAVSGVLTEDTNSLMGTPEVCIPDASWANLKIIQMNKEYVKSLAETLWKWNFWKHKAGQCAKTMVNDYEREMEFKRIDYYTE